MKTIWILFCAIACVVTFPGCASEIVPAGPDTYSISTGTPFITDSGGSKARAYRQANEFCAKRGLVMMPVSVDARDGQVGSHTASATLVFRALRPGDPELKRPNVEGPNYIERVQVR